MANFEPAVALVLSNEGGFVDNPKDSGGATNYGISLRFLREVPNERLRLYGIFVDNNQLKVDNIRELTREQAVLIYKGEFWDHAPFEKISSQAICNSIFDMACHSGIFLAIRNTQRALWAINSAPNFPTDDGILGIATLSMIGYIPNTVFLAALKAERAGFLRLLAQEQQKDKEFLHGWLERCYRS